MLYITTLQLNNFFDVGNNYLNLDRARNTEGTLNFENIEKMSNWVGNNIKFEIFYRLGKILLFDLFGIFAFFAINKTVDQLKD